MTLNECLNKFVITSNYNELTTTYEGNSYTFKIGDIIERLEIIQLIQYTENGITRKGCICKCSCGNYIGPIRLRGLLTGDYTSCGCYQRELHSSQLSARNMIHGDSIRNQRSKLYNIWSGMKDRALNTNRADSKYYSNKITICEDWKDYSKFKTWAINSGYQEGLSIDRIDNSKGYEPSNCRWILPQLQNSNKTNNRILTYKNKSFTITEWGRITGLTWNTINRRLKNGKTVGQALGYE